MEALQAAMQKRQYAEAGRLAREAFPMVARWLETERALPNGFAAPPSIPALYEGGIALAIENDTEGLAELRALIETVPAFHDRIGLAEAHESDRLLCRAIEVAVAEAPGMLQSKLKLHLGAPDGARVSRMVAYLEKAGRLRREKDGKNIRLLPVS